MNGFLIMIGKKKQFRKAMLNLTLKHALKNPVGGLPRMAALLHKKDEGLVWGWNSRKTHPLMAKFGKCEDAICLHAEIDAIKNAIRGGVDVRDSTMYVARVLKNGKPALAKPCEGCQRAIIAFGIKDVFWT